MNQHNRSPIVSTPRPLPLAAAFAGLLALVAAGCVSGKPPWQNPSGSTESSGTGASMSTGGMETSGAGGNRFDFGDAGPTADCSLPQITLLASGLHSPSLMATDDSTLYLLNGEEGGSPIVHILALPKSGGAPTEIAPMTEGTPIQVIVDATRIYWHASIALPSSTEHVIYSVLKTGGPVTQLTTSSKNLASLAVDDQRLFWESNGAIWRMPKDGGEAIVMGGGGVGVGDGMTLVLDDDFIFWSGGTNIGEILKDHVGEGGGTLPSQKFAAWEIIVDPAHLFYTSNGPSRVVSDEV